MTTIQERRAPALLANRDLMLVTLGFSLLLTAAQTAQQYVTVVFAAAGHEELGFLALFVVYAAFVLTSLAGPALVTRFGPRACFLGAVLCYTAFPLALAGLDVPFVMIAAVLIGAAAGPLWNGHFVVMGAVSADVTRGRSAGFFWAVFSAATGLGLTVSGLAIERWSFETLFVILAVLSLCALLPFARMGDAGRRPDGKAWAHLPMLTSPTVLRMSTCIFATYLIYGLAVSYVPLHIQAVSGTAMVGLLSAPFFVVPAIASLPLGRLGDRLGRTRAVTIGFAILCAGLVVMYAAATTAVLVAGILVLTLGFSLMNPLMTAMPIDLAPEALTERVAGTFNTMSALGITIGIFVPLLHAGPEVYLVLLAVLVLVFAVVRPLLATEPGVLRARVGTEVT